MHAVGDNKTCALWVAIARGQASQPSSYQGNREEHTRKGPNQLLDVTMGGTAAAATPAITLLQKLFHDAKFCICVTARSCKLFSSLE